MSQEKSIQSHKPTFMFKGYKPLTSAETGEYFYCKGTIHVLHEKHMEPIMTIRNKSWRDINRILIRLFRNEPKYAVMIKNHLMLLAESKSGWLYGGIMAQIQNMRK